MKIQKTNQITLDFLSDIKFTEFCVLVFSYLNNLLKIGEDNFFKIEISLREVINNAIIHGNKSNPGKRVHVTFKWTKSRFCVNIRDESGKYINFDEINRRLENNDLLSVNGRGIMIMRSYMDKVEFKPSEYGTEIMMEKNL